VLLQPVLKIISRKPWILLLSSLLIAASHSAPAATQYQGDIKPLIEKHCAACHKADKHKGNVDFSGFTDNLSVIKDHKLWSRALEQIASGDMPPDDEPKLPDDIKAKLLQNIQEVAENYDVNSPALRDPGPSVLRRLSRVEYENTLKDLLGIEFDSGREAGIAMEDNGPAYANLAAGLNMAPALMEKYFIAADKALDRLLMNAEERKKFAAKDYKTKMLAQSDEKAVKQFFSGLPALDEGSAESFFTTFMRRAYRRPVEKTEISRILKFHEATLAKGEPREAALHKALKPVLVSPHFLFRIESDRASKGSHEAYRVSEHELATRLSYFLWSSPPDDELMAVADSGKLYATLEHQLKRMLLSPKAEALTKNFAAHWLHIDHIAEARPSREAFPAFSDSLKKSMREEVEMFFSKLREEDRNVTELLQCDYAYVNWELAKLYGLEGNSKELQRVSLPKDSPRGGLLGMGGLLAINAHTNRTSPTLRGKWILEVVFGKPPPPPPANVAPLKAAKKGEPPKSLREQLAQHATEANCAGCHKRIDPLGFGLENFDAIGAWRESTPDAKLDTDGVLPTGEKFNGVRELRQVILKKQGEFLHNLVSQTLTYALGRELDYYDEGPIRSITAEMQKNGNKFSTLMLGIVNSYPFQYRKNIE
jgi:mono/diheme cytochrome c family protein